MLGITKYQPLYIWWVSTLLTATGFFWATYNGFLMDIWTKDVTHITSLALLLFLFGLANSGYLAWRLSKDDVNTGYPGVLAERKRFHKKLANRLWFLSEIEMALAIVGTSIGIIMLLGINGTATAADLANLQVMLTDMWSTLGVAFYPNAVGLIASIILKFQTFFITENHD